MHFIIIIHIYIYIYIHQVNQTLFDRSERRLVSTLDEMRSLWQEFVRRKAADTVVSKANCMGLPRVYASTVVKVSINVARQVLLLHLSCYVNAQLHYF